MSDAFAQFEMNDQPESGEETLGWLAFRYISGEMADHEVAAFEARLDAESELFEQAACEAVARAVQLKDAIVAAVRLNSSTDCVEQTAVAPQVSSSTNLTQRRDLVARRISLLASAVVVVAAGWLLTASFGPESTVKVVDRSDSPVVSVQPDVAGELVRFWVSSSTELALAADEPPVLSSAYLPDALSTDVPDWLFAAVQSREESAAGLSDPEVLEN